MYFIKLKKQDVYNKNFKKEILILWYLFTREGKDGNVFCSLKDIIEDTGFQLSRTKNGINDIFKYSLENLQKIEYISINSDLNSSKINTKLKFNFIKNNNQNYKCFDLNSDFIILNNVEMNSIFNYFLNNDKEKNNIDNVVKVFLIIKSFMNINGQNDSFCFPSIQKIECYSGLSKPTILKIINILKNINLLYTYDLGKYKTNSGNIKQQSLVYTLKKINIQLLKNNVSSLKNDFSSWI